MALDYGTIAEAYEKIERTSKRLEMTRYLVDLIRETPVDLLGKVVYLTVGTLYPSYFGIEIGIAEKLAARALVTATGAPLERVRREFRDTGDLGEVAEKLLRELAREAGRLQRPAKKLTVGEVHSTLDRIARTSGLRSVETKLTLLSDMLVRATPREAKYIMRTVTGHLRLGIGDLTLLDALAIVYGGGVEARREVERAYNVVCDLGLVSEGLARGGLEAIRKLSVTAGKPIRPMLAERLRSPAEILAKLGGRCAAEFKYDGERIQIHKLGGDVILFSRRIENITHQYPDVVDLVLERVKAKDAILEAECVAVNVETGELRPFQELMRRRRRHRIEEMALKYPISLFFFDALYVDGTDLTRSPYPERRAALAEVVSTGERANLTLMTRIDNQEALEKFFQKAVEEGAEGLVCKAIGEDAVYRAGARGFLWIKYKREYRSEMTDTVDLAVVGAFYGRGSRAGVYGALLLAVYEPGSDTFRTVTRCGTGFSNVDLTELPKRLAEFLLDHRHPRVNSRIEADVWFVPTMVIEIIGAEITLSPVHTTGLDAVRKGSGLAIRFPRFTGNYRLDKAPEDATTEQEVIEMYEARLHKVQG